MSEAGWRVEPDLVRRFREDPEAAAKERLGLGPDEKPAPVVVRFLEAIGKVFEGAPPGARLALACSRSGAWSAHALPEDVRSIQALERNQTAIRATSTEETAAASDRQAKIAIRKARRFLLLNGRPAEEVAGYHDDQALQEARTLWLELERQRRAAR